MNRSESPSHDRSGLGKPPLPSKDKNDHGKHQRNFTLNLANLAQNDGPQSSQDQKGNESPRQACETQRYNTTLLLDQNDTKIKPLLHQNFFNSPQKAQNNLKKQVSKEDRDAKNDSYVKICSPSSTYQFQNNVQKKGQKSLLLNNNYKVVQSIFNQDIKLLIRSRDCMDFETVLNLKANIYQSDPQNKVLSVELRDADDPNFLHLMECSEKDYDCIKKNELMLNEFQYFPDQFKNLMKKYLQFQELSNDQQNISQNELFYKCEFVFFSDDKSYLRFKQVNKEIVSDFMKLKLVNANNESIQRYLSIKLNVAMSGQPSQSIKPQESNMEQVFQKAEETSEHLMFDIQQLKSKIEQIKNEEQIKVDEIRKELHMQEESKLSQLREELLDQQAQMQENFEAQNSKIKESYETEIAQMKEKFESEKKSYFKTFEQTILKLQDKILSLQDELSVANEAKKEVDLQYQEQCDQISQFKKEIQSLHFISIEFLEKAKNVPQKQSEIDHLNQLNKHIEQSINNFDLISEKSALISQFKTPASIKKMQKDQQDDKKSYRSHLQTQNISKKLMRNIDQQSALPSYYESNFATEKKEQFSTHVGVEEDVIKYNGKNEVIFEEKSQSEAYQKISQASKINYKAPEYDDLVSIGNNSEDVRQIEKNRNAPKWIGQNIDPQIIKNEIIQRLQGEYDELVSMGNNSEDLRQIQMNINNVQKWYNQESKTHSLTVQKLNSIAEYDELISMGNNSEDLRQIEQNLKNVQKWVQLDNNQKQKIQAEYDELVSIGNNSEDIRQIEKNQNVRKWVNNESQKFIKVKDAQLIKQGEIIQASNLQQNANQYEIIIQNDFSDHASNNQKSTSKNMLQEKEKLQRPVTPINFEKKSGSYKNGSVLNDDDQKTVLANFDKNISKNSRPQTSHVNQNYINFEKESVLQFNDLSQIEPNKEDFN